MKVIYQHEVEYELDGDEHWGARDWNNEWEGYYSAPTQAVLQKWLREVKHIEVIVDIDTRVANYYEPMLGKVNQYADENTPAVVWKRFEGNKKYNDYEAALEAGLQKCLALILENK